MASVYFIGDLHLGHRNIMSFGQRDFKTIEDHDEGMIELWNSKIKSKRDLVWVLGDVAMSMESLKLLDKANGQKRLIMGNHDRFDIPVYLKYFEDIRAFEKRYGFVMSHIPIHPNELVYRSWNFNVHGHIHDPSKNLRGDKYFNANADSIGLIPVELDELRTKIEIAKRVWYETV